MSVIVSASKGLQEGNTYLTKIQTANHLLMADEPTGKGGSDQGPAPYDLLTSALVACTAITLRMYAQRKEWKVDHISVTVNMVAENEKPGAEFYFERIITVTGTLDSMQKDRLIQIANACPVHKILSAANRIESKLE